MLKIRKYQSLEELKSALAEAVSRKKRLEMMLRSGASSQEIESVGIHMVQFS